MLVFLKSDRLREVFAQESCNIKMHDTPLMSGSTQTRPHDCSQHFMSPSQSWSIEHSWLRSRQVDLSAGGTGHVPFFAEMHN